MEISGHSLKGPTTILFFTAIGVLITVLIIFQDSSFNQIQEFASKAVLFDEKAKNVTKLSTEFDSEEKNKLLGGLLASGFDQESCISRYQSSLYHRVSPYKPSPYLLSKLRKYENRHKRCGPYTKSYIKAVKELNFTHPDETRTTTTSCKYIVWSPSNGLGNRIVSMASAFLYAILTNRILLVDHGSDMVDLFCEPFPNTSWVMPMDFPFQNRLLNSLEMRNNHSFGNFLMKTKNISELPVPAFMLLYLAYDYNDQDKLFYLDQNQQYLLKVRWLILKSDQYFVPALFSIPSFRKELNILFPDKEVIFHTLSRYLFHPSNTVWGLITRFFQAYLAKADTRIGLQIRLFHPETSPHQLVIKHILSCTQQENLFPQLNVHPEHGNSSFWSKNISRKAVLVASLHSTFYENLKNMFLMEPNINGEAIGIFQLSHEEHQQFGDNLHNIKAWAEIYLLSMSDFLVTSTWSTFGYVAQGLGGLKPWILFIPNNQTSPPDPPCRRAFSMEPCFHFPPSFDRKVNRIVDNVVDPNIQHCEDVSWGLKLVNNNNYDRD